MICWMDRAEDEIVTNGITNENGIWNVFEKFQLYFQVSIFKYKKKTPHLQSNNKDWQMTFFLLCYYYATALLKFLVILFVSTCMGSQLWQLGQVT